ncbi:efflux RND transporter periplasmic adaptor subunit [Sinorhizobium meliloti]|uniref:efflux RND transporter periplasmic adaptor subunit n=1 Tax=Rhizobium meliloti TaxID=382 RepID=UPI0012971E5D|nr:efflux RND transporter periplasmic adaptor subunit [Sinorhizobium meliloti]MDW9592358.1 efflux RND transporter periplasmic adaptor subunit [Sinorhizobium meliloti]MDX0187182.1 efflux RND transporter periplasmic adaptor subunit [Sinorhizobium meliloti]MQV10448.1 efflux RND transporter periplasmic adaptor subunit [Sinorhizobium meliloti]MQV57843.1 efflux RND transporter periplasmic adaptor subunit [Sinorhizobium meliloti]
MAQKLLPLVGACAAMLLSALVSASAEEAVKSPQKQAPPSIVVTEATERAITDRVIATGSIEAVDEIYVSPLVDGLAIRSLNVDVGDRVEEGGTLAVLNEDALLLQKSQLEANLAKAEASLAQLHAQLAEVTANSEEATRVAERAVQLSKNGTVSTAEADRLKALAAAGRARVRSAEQSVSVATADIKVVQAQIDDVDLRLARTAVKAPVSGVISRKNAKVGAIASGSGEPLFAIIRDGEIEMWADVAESDVIKLAVGQTATVKLAGSTTTIEGKIRLIAPTVDPQTRLGTVRISLTDASKARAGMYASAVIVAEQKEAVVLPQTAVTSEDGKSIVRKVEDGVVRLVPVETGIQDGQFIEILSGIKPGEQAVAKAGAYVRDGDRINPVESAEPATN